MGEKGNLEWNKDLQPVQLPNENTDTESLEEQKRIRYKQDTRARAYLTRWVCTIVTLWLVFAISLNSPILAFKAHWRQRGNGNIWNNDCQRTWTGQHRIKRTI